MLHSGIRDSLFCMTFQAQGSVLFGVKNRLSQLKGKKTLIRFSSSIRLEVGGGRGNRKGIADLIKLGVKNFKTSFLPLLYK